MRKGETSSHVLINGWQIDHLIQCEECEDVEMRSNKEF